MPDARRTDRDPHDAHDAVARPTILVRLTSARAVFAALALTLLLVVLFTPQTQSTGLGGLDSRSAEPHAARALYTMLERLGWDVTRSSRPLDARLDTTAVYMILNPVRPVTSDEIHELLQAVRAGAGMMVATGLAYELADSLDAVLGVDWRGFGPLVTGHETDPDDCPEPLRSRGMVFGTDGRVHAAGITIASDAPPHTIFASIERNAALVALEAEAVAARVRGDTALSDSLFRESARLPRGSGPTTLQPAAAGFEVGDGRMVLLSGDIMLQNDVIRYCAWGTAVTAVRMVEWLSNGRQRQLIFDEWHRFNRYDPWPIRFSRFFFGNPEGRVAVTLVLAAATLLLALGRRPLAAVSVRRLERRSPLEHVDALARAYDQSRATRTVARRLVRGLRRRHTGLLRNEDDSEFLERVRDHHPGLQQEVNLLKQASSNSIPDSDLDRLLTAVDTVDQTLTTK